MPDIDLMFPYATRIVSEAVDQVETYITELGELTIMEIREENRTDFEKMLFPAVVAAVMYGNGERRRQMFSGDTHKVLAYKWEVFNGESSDVVEKLWYSYIRGHSNVTKEQLLHVRGVCLTFLEYIRSME